MRAPGARWDGIALTEMVRNQRSSSKAVKRDGHLMLTQSQQPPRGAEPVLPDFIPAARPQHRAECRYSCARGFRAR